MMRPAPDPEHAFRRRAAVHQPERRVGQDYFADGLTEDITRALGRFLATHSVLAYGVVASLIAVQDAGADGDRPDIDARSPGVG